jgi:hypothetical protein
MAGWVSVLSNEEPAAEMGIFSVDIIVERGCECKGEGEGQEGIEGMSLKEIKNIEEGTGKIDGDQLSALYTSPPPTPRIRR